jgi:hypothetical protein
MNSFATSSARSRVAVKYMKRLAGSATSTLAIAATTICVLPTPQSTLTAHVVRLPDIPVEELIDDAGRLVARLTIRRELHRRVCR